MIDRCLVAYSTQEGQSRKIAYHVAERLRDRVGRVDVYDVAHLPPDFDMAADRYDAAILAASVHQGHHAATAAEFVRDNLGPLSKVRSALVSVSLHACGDEADRREAEGYAVTFLNDTGWQPGEVHLAGGAIRFSHYDFFKRWIMKTLAKERGLDAEPGTDVEFTDWAALDGFVSHFAAASRPRTAGPARRVG